MNMKSRSSPIVLSSLAEARHPAGIREALRKVLGVISWSGIQKTTASGPSVERSKVSYQRDELSMRVYQVGERGLWLRVPVLPRVCTFAQAH
jgi:hypothetical protein